MLKLRFRYLLPLLLAVLSAGASAMAPPVRCDGRQCRYTVVYPVAGCTSCRPGEFSLDDHWRQYVTNQEIIGVELTSPRLAKKLTFLLTTPSGEKLAEITQLIDKPVSSGKQVFSLNQEAWTAFEQHAKNKNRLTIKVETAGGREENLRVQVVAIKYQGSVAKQ